jgi:hypothetical protein
MIAGQENDLSSTEPGVVFLTGEMDNALSIQHRMQRGQAIARELERPGCSQLADAKNHP